jgi:hypothetical protein
VHDERGAGGHGTKCGAKCGAKAGERGGGEVSEARQIETRKIATTQIETTQFKMTSVRHDWSFPGRIGEWRMAKWRVKNGEGRECR